MKARNLIYLTIITVIMVVAAVFTSQQYLPEPGKETELLLPDIKSRINDVAEITVFKDKKTLTLVNNQNEWYIKEADNYPALFSKIKTTIITLSELEIIDHKTKNPSLYAKLGVQDPNDNAESSLLSLKDNSGNLLTSLIIGKSRRSKSASDKPGFYVRLPGNENALLVAGNLDVSSDTGDWLERNLIDIQADRIREIVIQHQDNEPIILSRMSGEDELSLQFIPEGKQAESDAVFNRMETILENVYIDDVKSISEVEFPDAHTTTKIKTFDGLLITAVSASIDDVHYIHFTFSYDASVYSLNEATDATSTEEHDKQAPIDVKKEAESLSRLTADRVFQIPEYEYELFTKTLDGLVQDIPEEEPEDKAGAT